jgi:hypothetical protein
MSKDITRDIIFFLPFLIGLWSAWRSFVVAGRQNDDSICSEKGRKYTSSADHGMYPSLAIYGEFIVEADVFPQ